jgi:hypothetical protein
MKVVPRWTSCRLSAETGTLSDSRDRGRCGVGRWSLLAALAHIVRAQAHADLRGRPRDVCHPLRHARCWVLALGRASRR